MFEESERGDFLDTSLTKVDYHFESLSSDSSVYEYPYCEDTTFQSKKINISEYLRQHAENNA